ncbi:MAG: hypothetical protein HYU80_01130 [Candidatus Blackburnbacteria bacterium]|nr:hypothetical protein [Candidatus Blackburnbacteria bacterium]
MDLPKIFQKSKDEVVEYFWSIVICKSWVDSGIWCVTGENAKVVSRGGAFSWQQGNPESLVEATDSSLSAAASYLEEDQGEPLKVVFGLPPSWTEDGSIKESCLSILRKLSRELELTPAGFVVLPDAITHLLKAREGAPPSVIFVGLFEDTIDVTISQSGTVLGTAEVARSMSLGADIAEGLARLPSAYQYPTRILLYNHRSVDLEGARQELLNVDWANSGVTFLHTPKVEVLSEDVGVLAVSLAGASEVGQAKGIMGGGGDTKDTETEKAEEVVGEGVPQIVSEELGFVKDADIAEQDVDADSTSSLQADSTSSLQADSTSSLQADSTSTSAVSSVPNGSLQEVIESKEENKVDFGFLPNILGVFGKVFHLGKLRFVVLGVGVILLFVLGVFVYWYLPKARVIVFVAPKKLEKTLEFKVKVGLSSVDVEQKEVPGKVLGVQVSAEKQKSVTGTKRVGEKAKGEVTVYRVGQSVTLPSGTVLSSPNGLKFTLNEDVKVASGSAGPDSLGKNITPARVTALNVGAEYNLSSGVSFKIGNFSTDTTTAKNTSEFTGGTSRDVSAVSSQDKADLEKEVKEEIKNQAMERAKSQVGSEEILIGDRGSITIGKQEFSSQVGEEADTLSVTTTATVRFTVVSKEHIQKLLVSQMEKEVPQEFGFVPDRITTEITAVASKDDKEEKRFKVQGTANLLPAVSSDNLIKEIAGKSLDAAKERLSKTPGYTRAQITFTSKLPITGSLPRPTKNITVDIVAEQ